MHFSTVLMHQILSFSQVNNQLPIYRSLCSKYKAIVSQVKKQNETKKSKQAKTTLTSENDNALKYLTSIYFTIIGTNVISMFHRF